MHFADAFALVLAVASGTAFLVGERALARADDGRAIYWLIVGVVSLYAAVEVAKPGAGA
jgi:hypothetical protein